MCKRHGKARHIRKVCRIMEHSPYSLFIFLHRRIISAIPSRVHRAMTIPGQRHIRYTYYNLLGPPYPYSPSLGEARAQPDSELHNPDAGLASSWEWSWPGIIWCGTRTHTHDAVLRSSFPTHMLLLQKLRHICLTPPPPPPPSPQFLQKALPDQALDVALAHVELAVLGQVDRAVLGLDLAGVLEDAHVDEEVARRDQGAGQVDVGVDARVGSEEVGVWGGLVGWVGGGGGGGSSCEKGVGRGGKVHCRK